jgi:SAM-dependent methyltransferase
MPDAHYEHPRLAAVYDPLDPDRSDLGVYLSMAHELGARTVLDVGAGTGTFALMLADRGIAVTALEPAAASLDVARSKPGAQRVTWLLGDATTLPALQVDLATMTANVAQAICSPDDWAATLAGIWRALRPGGWLVFETRIPARRAWEEWNRTESWTTADVIGEGVVESWYDVLDVDGPLVTFRGTYTFRSDRAVLTSDSTLRFRERSEIDADLLAAGFSIEEVRDAPDRPGREFVYLARRPESAQSHGERTASA